jgi:hypothetical protein
VTDSVPNIARLQSGIPAGAVPLSLGAVTFSCGPSLRGTIGTIDVISAHRTPTGDAGPKGNVVDRPADPAA